MLGGLSAVWRGYITSTYEGGKETLPSVLLILPTLPCSRHQVPSPPPQWWGWPSHGRWSKRWPCPTCCWDPSVRRQVPCSRVTLCTSKRMNCSSRVGVRNSSDRAKPIGFIPTRFSMVRLKSQIWWGFWRRHFTGYFCVSLQLSLDVEDCVCTLTNKLK